MVAIVGLGNVGEKYRNTRHNVGFMFVDYLAKQHRATLENQNKFFSDIAKSKELLLFKPQTMMNASGKAVSAIVNFYSVGHESLYVAHDDLDLPLGEYKIQFEIGPKVHNGVNSIEEFLGSSQFWRVRIGIDNRDPENRTPGEAYVLQKFTDEEMRIIDDVIKSASAELLNKING